MVKGNFLNAMDKITDCIAVIGSNNEDLRTSLIKFGSKNDNNELNELVVRTIQVNTEYIKETMQLIQEFKNFNFRNASSRSTNIKQINLLESKLNTLKHDFNKYTEKIMRQNKSYVESSRTSRLSIMDEGKKSLDMMQFSKEDLMEDQILRHKEEQIKEIVK